MRSTYAPAQLVQLRQAKFICALNQYGVGARHIDTGFNNGGAHQYIKALMVEV